MISIMSYGHAGLLAYLLKDAPEVLSQFSAPYLKAMMKIEEKDVECIHAYIDLTPNIRINVQLRDNKYDTLEVWIYRNGKYNITNRSAIIHSPEAAIEMWPEINDIPIMDWIYNTGSEEWYYLWNDEVWEHTTTDVNR